MALFGKLASSVRTVGAKLFGTKKEASAEAQRLRQAEQVAKARADRAEREAAEIARQARSLSSSTSRAGAATRAGEQALERQRRQLIELAQRERVARQQATTARREQEEARKAAAIAEGQASLREQTQTAAREVQAQQRGVRYKSEKVYGTGTSPGWDDFLMGHPFSRFSSSNVETIVYDQVHQNLYVKFIGGDWYKYHDIPKTVAHEAFIAASKGVWIWSRIRVRGKGNAKKTRKRFDRGIAPPSDLPLKGSAAEFAKRGGGL